MDGRNQLPGLNAAFGLKLETQRSINKLCALHDSKMTTRSVIQQWLFKRPLTRIIHELRFVRHNSFVEKSFRLE